MSNTQLPTLLKEVSKVQQSNAICSIFKIVIHEKGMSVLEAFYEGDTEWESFLQKDASLVEQISILSEGVKRGEKQFSFEYFSQESKQWFYIRGLYADELYEDRDLVYYLYVTDITKLKEELLEVKQSNYEYEALTRSISTGIIKIQDTEDFPILWSNHSFNEMLGYEDGKFFELYHISSVAIVEEEDQERFVKLVTSLHYQVKTKPEKVRIRNKRGELRWFDIRLERGKDILLNKNAVFYCVLNDVTEEVMKDQELKNFQERYNMVLTVTSELVFEYAFKTKAMTYFGGDRCSLVRPSKIENFLEDVLKNGINGAVLTEESKEEMVRFFRQFYEEKLELNDAYLCYEYEDGHIQWVYIVGKCIFSTKHEADIIIGKVSDVTLHKEEENKLLYKARTDSLTKLYNREFTVEEIRNYLSVCSNSILPTMLIVDIDNFKSVNDNYGHAEGDKVLIEVASILKKEFRNTDIIGRLGGDEFVIFMKDIVSDDIVYEKANNICNHVYQRLKKVSVSIGISVIKDMNATFERLYRTADIALYEAKVKGKNTYVSYSDLTESVKEQILLEEKEEVIDIKQKVLPKFEEEYYYLNIAKSVMQTYDYCYAVNLSKDKVYRVELVRKQDDEHAFSTYTELFWHILQEVNDKEEQKDFMQYMKLEQLIEFFESGEKIAHRYYKIKDTKGEFHWYMVEMILDEAYHIEKAEDLKCMILFKDVQKSRNEELRRFESKTKRTYIQQLEEQKTIDSLTSLYVPDKFYEVAKTKILSEVQSNYAIVTFDIDRFRVMNDVYSEKIGDQVICFLADVLREIDVPDKVFGRYYADCFTILFSYETKQDILNLMDEIREQCKRITFISTSIKLSFGVYLIVDRSMPIRLMCDWARLAKQAVKGLSMQYYAFYNEEYRTQLVETQKIEEEMHDALAKREFQMYLQPKYNLETNQVVGAEALVRWHHSKKGILYPNKFIPLFEKNGFILRLDEYMWEQACIQIRSLIDMGIYLPISVNISRLHTYDLQLVKKLTSLVKQYDIPVELLELEFTEGLFVENVQALYNLMNELKQQGFVLLMDDFGSGYSSLNMLKSVPIDVIKLDKVFFEDMVENERGKIIIENSIKMIHDLKLQVMAEGIETKEHVDFLKQSNCKVGQGYYYAKPMTSKEFVSYYIPRLLAKKDL